MNFLHFLAAWVVLCFGAYWWMLKGAKEGDNE